MFSGSKHRLAPSPDIVRSRLFGGSTSSLRLTPQKRAAPYTMLTSGKYPYPRNTAVMLFPGMRGAVVKEEEGMYSFLTSLFPLSGHDSSASDL